ncbi:helix-turn-helix domain-containing protein [Dyadobacter sp. CY261]|uniref:helix-turn-helix domain-containing protein n=1 Tax=Dyadobacter sp. CY261 TaxID=2907203 RepID=UPI001F1C388B|nr:helix-turn-helix transcriptional regulator [Dyadobacter sp. CY261]MCF0074003.1 helix-turn-helix domain-containing protein [Dyadobacter sp. CY261]
MKSFGERLRHIMELKSQSAYIVSKHTGVSEATIGRLLKDSNKPNQATISTLAGHFGVNVSWLGEGEGEMMKEPGSKSATESNAVPINIPETPFETIKREDGTEFLDIGEGRFLMVTPLVEQVGYAGYVSGWADPEYVEELPKHAVVVNKLHFGTYRTFQVRGDSMNNESIGSIASGDLVTGRRLQRKHWTSKLHFNKHPYWVIVKYDGIIIKKIVGHDVESGVITYESLNPNYGGGAVHLDEVQELYNILLITRET